MSSTYKQLFEQTLDEFKKDLSKKERESFKFSTLEDLKKCLASLQEKQQSQRRVQNLNRLAPFLEGMDQFGKVVEMFCNSSEFVPFVWGPAKFLLQVASTWASAFSELLDTYEYIGESLPLLLQYQELFHEKPHMIRVLSLMYKDILKFHRIAMKYFQQRRRFHPLLYLAQYLAKLNLVWKQLFDATWKTHQSKFSSIISNIGRHRALIESHASATQIEEFQQSRRTEDDRYGIEVQNEEMRRLRAIFSWLRAPDADTDQYNLSQIRAENPGTGRWLLDNQAFKDWFDPNYPKIPPLLWINGMPGAGKTILASLAIEEARKLIPKPTVLFFYCKHDNPEADNFMALARSLLAQILKQDRNLLLYFYQQCCDSTEAVLTSPEKVNKLLDFAFKNCKSAYIIIDGLDECERDQRKSIAQWFRTLVESLPVAEPWRLRCLFISQNDSLARKDFDEISSLSIGPDDIKNDLDSFCQHEADQLRSSLQLSEERANSIASTVAQRAGGIFLLAKLLWLNLSAQNTIVGLEYELDPNIFPSGINEAYRRILSRIKETPSRTATRDAMMLLEWLVLARKPLKWREIQALKSMNTENQSIDFDRQKFLVKDPREIGGSFVKVREDGSVELIHLTAKLFLLDEGYVDPLKGDIRMAARCIDYLNFPIFINSPTEFNVRRGDYGFMEYAILHWVRHLEGAIAEANRRIENTKAEATRARQTSLEEPDEPSNQVALFEEDYVVLMASLAESLGVLIDMHWTKPRKYLDVSARNKRRLRVFVGTSFYEELEQVVVSTKKQLHSFGPMKPDNLALNLFNIVGDVREVMENIVKTDPSAEQDMAQKYGDNLFRCSRFSCQFFSSGFASSEDREKHIQRHTRPHRCNEENCASFVFGFASDAGLKRHMKEAHPDPSQQSRVFPTDKDIQLSIQPKSPERQADPPPAPGAQAPQIVEAAIDVTSINRDESPSSESEPDVRPTVRTKPNPEQDLKCPFCRKEFKRLYNLKSHLLTHTPDRPYACDVCAKRFTRKNDCNRHKRIHLGVKDWVCGGCQVSFTRADMLNNHHRAPIGQACLAQIQRESQAQAPEVQMQSQGYLPFQNGILGP